MQKSWTLMAALMAALALAAAVALAPVVTAEDDDGDDDELTIETVVEALGKAKLTLTDAVGIAVTKTGGQAVAAGFELEGEAALFEVLLYIAGDDAHFVEVEVDAASGKILEIEREDLDDEDADDEEDDGDDD